MFLEAEGPILLIFGRLRLVEIVHWEVERLGDGSG